MAVTSAMATLAKIKRKITYPTTSKGATVDAYFDTKLPDPYRWLEDDKSAETGAWVKAQNEVTYGYLNQIPFRCVKSKNGKTVELRKNRSAFQRRNFTYYYKNNGLQNQSVLYRKDAKGTETVFLDPNTFLKTEPHHLADWIFPKTVQK
jgi:prolyl oligopeptidase